MNRPVAVRPGRYRLPHSMRFHVVPTIACTLTILIVCGNSGSSDDALVVSKDLRSEKDDTGFYVVFCARDVLPGHAFVVWGKEDPDEQLCSVEAWGYYPASGSESKAILGAVPSELADEFIRGQGTRGDCRLVLQVTKQQFAKSETIRKKWAARTDYHVLEASCVTFASDVAKSLQLNVPKGIVDRHPRFFVRELANQNKR